MPPRPGSSVINPSACALFTIHYHSETYFVTFPYPYMNGALHLGHAFTVSKVFGYFDQSAIHLTVDPSTVRVCCRLPASPCAYLKHRFSLVSFDWLDSGARGARRCFPLASTAQECPSKYVNKGLFQCHRFFSVSSLVIGRCGQAEARTGALRQPTSVPSRACRASRGQQGCVACFTRPYHTAVNALHAHRAR